MSAPGPIEVELQKLREIVAELRRDNCSTAVEQLKPVLTLIQGGRDAC